MIDDILPKDEQERVLSALASFIETPPDQVHFNPDCGRSVLSQKEIDRLVAMHDEVAANPFSAKSQNFLPLYDYANRLFLHEVKLIAENDRLQARVRQLVAELLKSQFQKLSFRRYS